MTEQQSPREVAEQQLVEQESAERERRKAALEQQERNRREAERQEQVQEQARDEARQRAGELAEKRAEIEVRAEAKLAELQEVIEELAGVDGEHIKALSQTGDHRGTIRREKFSRSVKEWITVSLLEKLPGQGPGIAGPDRARSLRALDPLTETPEGEQATSSGLNPRSPGPAHATLEALQAEGEAAKERAEVQRRRHEEERSGKRRDPQTGELVAAERVEG